MGIPFEISVAVDAAADEHLAFPQFRDRLRSRYGGHLTPGEAACFASHAVLWEECAAGDQAMLILEDNLEMRDGLLGTIAAAKAELDAGGAYIRLAATIPRKFVPVRERADGAQVVRYLKGPSGSQAYAISPEGARALLRGARQWAEPIDDYLDRFWLHGLAPLAIHPLQITRADIPTTIPRRKRLSGLALFRRRLVRNWDGLRRLIYNASRLA